MLCHWAEIIVKGKPEISSSIDSVALPFEALRIKKGFILEIYNVEWNEYLTECSIVLSKRLSISEAHNWLYAAFQKKYKWDEERSVIITLPSHTTAMRNDESLAGCVWNCDRVRNYAARDSGSERRDQQLETRLRGSESLRAPGSETEDCVQSTEDIGRV